MPFQNINLNTPPYYSDYDETKNYHAVLYRPTTAVQARELIESQLILQTQIERFGGWAFKNGDIVYGCSISDIPSLPYVRLQDSQTNSAAYDILSLPNTQIVCVSSNLQARVLTSTQGLVFNYPNTNIVYVSYLNTGTGGQAAFSNTDQLTFYKIPQTGNAVADTIAVVNVYSNTSANTYTVGNAHGISVSDGVVFIDGAFVRVPSPTIGLVNAYGTYAANNLVGFKAVETIITENQDSSLTDNALGYPNENAPGAHRLKITPVLYALDSTTAANTSGFNPIATYNYGSLVSKATAGSNVYSIVGDAINQRTYEQAGNFVVNPFAVDTVTTLLSNSIVSNLDANNVLLRINPGSGYAQGSRVEILKTQYATLRRGVDTQVNKSQQITFGYGNYFVLNEVAGSFDFSKAQTVNFYDSSQKAVTTRAFSSLSPSGNLIGNASVRCFEYNSGIPGTNTATYLLHIFNIQLANSYKSTNIKSIYYNGIVKGVGDIYSNGVIGSSNKDQLYSFGVNGLKSLRDGSNNNNTQYVYRSKTSTTMSTNGSIVITLPASSPGGIDVLPYGNSVLSDADASTFNVTATANIDSSALSGTVTVYTTSANVLGSSTTFTSNFNVGDQIKVGSDIRNVTSIINTTFLLADTVFSANASGQAYKKSYVAGKLIPVLQNISGVSGFVQITNSTSFTISTGQAPSSALNVDVVYDVLRTQAAPAKKIINKTRFVKINTASNPNGPWCLGYPDIHKVVKIYGSPSSYTTSGSDITNQFAFTTGQKDTHYDLGYIYPVNYSSTSNPCLLVQLDYFSSNTAAGLGFYTVESYPIDDANTANNIAIQTKDITLYVDEQGSKTYLRDFIDFRTPAILTANDTGTCDSSNSTQVTAAISYASLTPSNTLSFSTPVNGLNVPSYGRNLQADFTNYLSRKDLVYITPDNNIKIKEGISSLNPQTPLYPETAMPISVMNIPPYPSLSTDQTDSQLSINQLSKNLTRDTSSAISTNLVTNRRYTMRDIGKLDQRITNLEYYVQLSLLEKKAIDLTVTDANGLNRFKNGIFVDSFSNFTCSEVTNPEYSIAIDTVKGFARPKISREVIKIVFNVNISSNVQQTGRIISLPYTESSILYQPYATQYRSAAHVAYAWNGKIILIPSYDNHIDYNKTGSVNSVVDNVTPWADFAQSPFNSIWGDWRTTSNVASGTVVSSPSTGNQNLNNDLGTTVSATNGWSYLNIPGNLTDYIVGNITNFTGQPISY